MSRTFFNGYIDHGRGPPSNAKSIPAPTIGSRISPPICVSTIDANDSSVDCQLYSLPVAPVASTCTEAMLIFKIVAPGTIKTSFDGSNKRLATTCILISAGLTLLINSLSLISVARIFAEPVFTPSTKIIELFRPRVSQYSTKSGAAYDDVDQGRYRITSVGIKVQSNETPPIDANIRIVSGSSP
ncbi:hypothetical protein DERP_002451 [Dermatophagoides pteronyssinus]|uniref:Uncharacterized protein n=1 Tax=Dermatophagoides pteronyssinus TaxID=6956 RepID=A0ABQ8JIJ1_DERPT|nr:hypothetical protein DERP_002451 [Dermatophagoides pteronyssinus]